MNFKARAKVFFSIILIVGMCLALIVWMDQRRASATSDSAEISAESYSVGIDHSGTITRQYIEAGDRVVEGQTLFQVKSTSLREQISELNLTEAQLLYPLNEEGEILVKASKAGLVSEVAHTQGSFVPANEKLATIIDQSSLEVVATYKMARRDFTKLNTQDRLDVQLPGGEWTYGTVRNIEVVEKEDAEIIVELTADIENSGNNDFKSTNGVPVETKVRLNDETLYDKIRTLALSAYERVRA